MKTATTSTIKNRELSHLALALALSAGTVGGMMTFAVTTEPAFAQAAGGGGKGGGGGGAGAGGTGGGAEEDVMNPNAPATHARRPNRAPVVQLVRAPRPSCEQSTDGADLKNCRYTQRPTPRIVSINGFANCAVVHQAPSGQFYCVRPM